LIKDKLINETYKVLCVYESYEKGLVTFENYKCCLRRVIIMLSGVTSCDVVLNSIIELNGLRILDNTVTHKDVKQIVLHITNEIKRNLDDNISLNFEDIRREELLDANILL
jgi:hypothetical protein